MVGDGFLMCFRVDHFTCLKYMAGRMGECGLGSPMCDRRFCNPENLKSRHFCCGSKINSCFALCSCCEGAKGKGFM